MRAHVKHEHVPHGEDNGEIKPKVLTPQPAASADTRADLMKHPQHTETQLQTDARAHVKHEHVLHDEDKGEIKPKVLTPQPAASADTRADLMKHPQHMETQLQTDARAHAKHEHVLHDEDEGEIKPKVLTPQPVASAGARADLMKHPQHMETQLQTDARAHVKHEHVPHGECHGEDKDEIRHSNMKNLHHFPHQK
eukprot:g3049.t1